MSVIPRDLPLAEAPGEANGLQEYGETVPEEDMLRPSPDRQWPIQKAE